MRIKFNWDQKNKILPLKVMHSEPNAIDHLAQRLSNVINMIPSHQPLVIVCIGTDRSTGDALGPLVGTHLRRVRPDLNVYGTLSDPVHAVNLHDTIDHIVIKYDDPYVIAIDACLGQLASVGSIQFGDGPIKPGAGVNKELPPIGHVHITGVVNVGGFMEYFVLQNTRLNLVFDMADVISTGLHRAMVMTSRFTAATLLPD